MAQPVEFTYVGSSGQPIIGGRWNGGVLSGTVNLSDVAVSGTFSPSIPPPETEGDIRYRYQAERLFQPTPVYSYPTRLPGGFDFAMEVYGPTADYVSPPKGSGWPWANRGGDWFDANGTRQGTASWVTATLNAVAGPSAVWTYSINVTNLMQRIRADGRWNALMLRSSNASRAIAGTTSANPPRIDVTYTDGSTATLTCYMTAAISTGTSLPNTLAQQMALPAMVEFAKPEKDVQAATMTLTVTQHWSGSASLQVFILDPAVNTDPIVFGVAYSSVKDVDLASHPSIIGVHRIMDGTTLDDFTSRSGEVRQMNFNAIAAYDPAIYGTGAEDLTLLPHTAQGRWVTTRDGWSVVNSDYTGEGFEPLTPGMGAIRLHRPAEVFADGTIVGYATSNPVNAKLFMPPDKFGLLREIYVRYYIRIGTADGQPMVNSINTRYQVYNQAGANPVWSDGAGKWMIWPAHDCTDGGVTGTSGGGFGWQARGGWVENDLPGGPDVGGWSASPHFYDFQANNPPGYRYGSPGVLQPYDFAFGQRGGLAGMFYAHKWYCVEAKLKLNSVDAPGILADGSPHLIGGVQQYWTPDGEMEFHLDGRLAYRKTGMVMRSLPLRVRSSYDPNIYIPAVRELGIRDLWLNVFHGGLTKRCRPQYVFITGLAWGTSYIGPMNLGT